MSALALLASAALAAAPHPDSSSSSTVSVEPGRVRVELVCQTRSLAEALPVDANADLSLDAAELAAGRAAIEDYALAHYRVLVGSGGDPERGRALEGRLTGLSAALDDDPFVPEERVTLELLFPHPDDPQGGRFDELLIGVSLFERENPFHFDACTLRWGEAEPQSFLFGIDGEAWWVESAGARRPRVLSSFFRLGVEHIATGYDHLAFLLALLLAARGVRSLVGVVTAFTAAHSLTLAAAALGWVRVPGSLVELSIAMSIAYVGALNLLLRTPSARWGEAFAFGLVHGLGFAGFVGEALASEPLVLSALLGFNLGVEAGQLAVVAALGLAVAWLPGDRAGPARSSPGAEGGPGAGDGAAERAWLAPRWLRLAGSAGVLACGGYWFLERAGWLPGIGGGG